MKSFDPKSKILENHIMEALIKLVQDKPHGRWFKFDLELSFQAKNNPDGSVNMSAVILKPKEEVITSDDTEIARTQVLKGSKDGAASFMKAVRELEDEEPEDSGTGSHKGS